MQSAESLEKTLMLGKIEGKGEGEGMGWDGQIASLIQWAWIWTDWEIVKDGGAWIAAVHGVIKSWTWLNDWTTTSNIMRFSPAGSLRHIAVKCVPSVLQPRGEEGTSAPALQPWLFPEGGKPCLYTWISVQIESLWLLMKWIYKIYYI